MTAWHWDRFDGTLVQRQYWLPVNAETEPHIRALIAYGHAQALAELAADEAKGRLGGGFTGAGW